MAPRRGKKGGGEGRGKLGGGGGGGRKKEDEGEEGNARSLESTNVIFTAEHYPLLFLMLGKYLVAASIV